MYISGEVTKHPKKEEYEIQVTDFSFYQVAEEYPIAKKEHGIDFLLDNRHLWLRSQKQWAIQRVRDTLRIKMRTLTKLGLLLSLAVIPAKIHAEQAQNLKCSRAAYLQAANQNDAAVARLLEQASQADAQAQTAEGIAQRETANYTHEDAVIRYYDVQIKFIRDKDKPGLTSYHTSPHYGTIMAAPVLSFVAVG